MGVKLRCVLVSDQGPLPGHNSWVSQIGGPEDRDGASVDQGGWMIPDGTAIPDYIEGDEDDSSGLHALASYGHTAVIFLNTNAEANIDPTGNDIQGWI